MCQKHHHSHAVLTRRDFLKFAGIAAGAPFVEVIARHTPNMLTQPLPVFAQGEAADLILVGGNVIAMDGAQRSVQAVAVKDGLIMQVGTDAAIRALAGPETQTVELRGRTVTPGLIDAHNHLAVYGTLLKTFLPFLPPDVISLDSLLQAVRNAVSSKPAGEWVQGYFLFVDPLPTAADLDTVSPNNPVWLIQQGGHYGIANSAAIALAGITAATADPDGGIIERDANGALTGRFYNHRAMDLLRAHAPQSSSEDMLQNLRGAEADFAAVGVTTYQDCNARFQALEAYTQAYLQHNSLIRSQIFYTLEWPRDVQIALEQIQYFADDFTRFAGFKLLIDGQFPTWYTHEPHPGIRWDMPTWDPVMFKNVIRRLHDTGLQISVHCGGDAAFDLTLDAFEEAMNANPRPDPRHRIEHGILCTPEGVQRAADLGVHISTQPQFIRLLKDVNKLGEERAARAIVTRDWLDAGINVALGSDAPSTPWIEPQITLLAAVLRPDGNLKPFHPEQAMTIQEALYAHTMGSAKAAFEENVKGSLEPGKFADLVVWSDDFYSVKPTQIAQVKAELTLVGGEVVHPM